MKITKQALNTIIENYLNDSMLNEVQVGTFKTADVERCDFEPDPEFFEYFTIMFTGKSTGPSNFRGKADDLPTWISPAFSKMFTDAAAPLLNAYGLIPVFNQQGKCDLLKKIQQIFIDYKRAYGEGIELNKADPDPPPDNDIKVSLDMQKPKVTLDTSEISLNYNVLLNKNGIHVPNQSNSKYLGKANIHPNVSSHDTVLVTAILGNLEKASYDTVKTTYDNLLNLKSKNRNVSTAKLAAVNPNLTSEQNDFLIRTLDMPGMPSDKKGFVITIIDVITDLNSVGIFK